MDSYKLKIKLFNFPSFEDWYNDKFQFKFTIGAYTCTSSYESMYYKSDNLIVTNETGLIISICTMKKGHKQPIALHSYFYPIEYSDIEKRKDEIEEWYNDTIKDFHKRWKTFIENTYLEFNKDNYYDTIKSRIGWKFDDYDDAVKYSKGDPTNPDSRRICHLSYIGQIIGVKESDGAIIAYEITPDRTLKPLCILKDNEKII
jgi:hypothetical protein